MQVSLDLKNIEYMAEEPIKCENMAKPIFLHRSPSLHLFLSVPTFLSLSPSVFVHLSALWCQFSVLAFTRQMLVCHTLSLIPHKHKRARAHARLNARASACQITRCQRGGTSRRGRTRTHTRTSGGSVEMHWRTQWGGEINNMQTSSPPWVVDT